MSSDKSVRIALFEDSEYLGKLICPMLKNWGFTVCWVIKILDILDHGMHCLCRDAENESANQRSHFIEFAQMPFACALLDGTLGKTGRPQDGPHGWDVLPHLRRQGLPCIAISNDPHTNHTMITGFANLGAQFATSHKQRRPDLFQADVEGFLTSLALLPPAASATSADTT